MSLLTDLTHELIAPPEAIPTQAEIEAEIARIKAKLDVDYKMLRNLRAYGTNEIDSLDPLGVSGPLASIIERVNSNDGRLFFSRWALFFRDNLDDLDRFKNDIDDGLLNEPEPLADVLELSNELIMAAEESL